MEREIAHPLLNMQGVYWHRAYLPRIWKQSWNSDDRIESYRLLKSSLTQRAGVLNSPTLIWWVCYQNV